MKAQKRLSASFKKHYWCLVEECIALFPGSVRTDHRPRLARARRGASELTYHVEPIEAAKLLLGVGSIPEDVADAYRRRIQRRFAALAD